MTDRPLITHERLLEVLSYDPETGELRWRIKPTARMSIGDRAGTAYKNGRVRIMVDGHFYYAHRLAWFYMTGKWPANKTDHKDRNPANNRFNNLRQATDAQNAKNAKLRCDNSSGHRGVRWHKKCRKWEARIRVDRKLLYLGLFSTINDAVSAYREASQNYYGEFANHT